MTCENIYVFYEMHSDLLPALTITQLLPTLQKIGVTTLAIEEPSDETEDDILNVYNRQLNHIKKHPIKTFKDRAVKGAIEGLGLYIDGIGKLTMESAKQLPNEEKQAIVHYIQSQQSKMFNSVEKQVELIKTASALGMEYLGCDISRNTPRIPAEHMELRDNHMFKQLSDQCNDKSGDIVFLVGVGHYGVANFFIGSNVTVKEYYIASEKVAFLTEEEPEDYCIRQDSKHPLCESVDFHGKVLDVIVNPNLNPFDIISQDLAGEDTVEEL